jgi:hypothetical protein
MSYENDGNQWVVYDKNGEPVLMGTDHLSVAQIKRVDLALNTGEYRSQCENFVSIVANMTMDGEEDEDGNPFEMICEDAIETLNNLIASARHILAGYGEDAPYHENAELARLRLENEGLKLENEGLTRTVNELVNRVMELRKQIPDLAAIVGDGETGEQPTS